MQNENLAEVIQKTRKAYNISLYQMGKLIGVPASTIKRWEENSIKEPRLSHKLQIALVIYLITNPDMVYAEFARQGTIVDRKKWDFFADKIKAFSAAISSGSNLRTEDSTIVIQAVSGLMALLAQQYLASVPPLSKIKSITKLLSELLR